MSRTHYLNPRITGMICPRCQKRYPVGDYFFGCPACLERGASSNLTLVYEGKAQIQKDATGWHRYRDFLPYDDTVSLGEGFTPVRTFPRLAKELGFRKLYTKHEFQNPTGSHKDRMNPFITARAREAGYSTVTCASSGNEAASLAAYAAMEGLNCVNVSTRSIPSLWKNASDATGAELLSIVNNDENKCFGATFRTPPKRLLRAFSIRKNSLPREKTGILLPICWIFPPAAHPTALMVIKPCPLNCMNSWKGSFRTIF